MNPKRGIQTVEVLECSDGLPGEGLHQRFRSLRRPVRRRQEEDVLNISSRYDSTGITIFYANEVVHSSRATVTYIHKKSSHSYEGFHRRS